MSELEHFARIAGDNAFKAWIEKEKTLLVKILATAEGPVLHRAQGRYSMLVDIEDRLEKAKGLR